MESINSNNIEFNSPNHACSYNTINEFVIERDLSSFEKFVDFFTKESYKDTNISWSKERDSYNKQLMNKRKIVYKELLQFDGQVK